MSIHNLILCLPGIILSLNDNNLLRTECRFLPRPLSPFLFSVKISFLSSNPSSFHSPQAFIFPYNLCYIFELNIFPQKFCVQSREGFCSFFQECHYIQFAVSLHLGRLTFGAGWSCAVGGCPVHCRRLSSIPASSYCMSLPPPQRDTLICLSGTKSPSPFKKHCSKSSAEGITRCTDHEAGTLCLHRAHFLHSDPWE